MTEIFSSLYSQTEPQGPAGPSAMGFGPGKPLAPPVPQNPVHMAVPMSHQLVDEGPPLRKSTSMNEPFYLVRELPMENELTGNTNLITHYSLEHAYNKFCGKKVKEKLSNFLPELPGMIDISGHQDGSSLHSLIEKPPVCNNSFSPLTGTMLTGFRLHTGPYRLMHIQPPKKKSKNKRHHRPDPLPPETPSDSDHKKKKKKKDDDPERKKKKKDKKKKKNRHSPDHPGMTSSQPSGSSLR
ncbi:mediator of RNA polymerase II transcription subunit 19-B isoform X2 [Trichomycterus rosablanca]|uniref:mediator of RNA polymerase II transcription subunit 19-B isoform X2 n=1 Tax=Trichomycterus rosablanca TaxID=2290929 RepID=UPI002F35165D